MVKEENKLIKLRPILPKGRIKVIEPRHEWDYNSTEPVICEVFGCGGWLTRREQLFGNRCIIHSEKIVDKKSNILFSLL